MTLRICVRTLSCAGLLSLAGCQVAPADRINAALPPGDEIAAAQEAMFAAARAQKMDASALDAELRDRMDKRALRCAAGYVPGVFDGNDQIREKLIDTACFADADARLLEWLQDRRSAMLGEPRMAPPVVGPARAVTAPRVVVERESATGTPRGPAASAPRIDAPAAPASPRSYETTHFADQTPPGQIDVPSDARVVAIGVYEAADGVHSFAGPRQAGTVNVFVATGTRPIVLVLSSYEPVNWHLQLQDGAQVSHVLLSGYHASQVSGAPAARIENIGTQYAYQRGSPQFESLDGLVRQSTGKRIDSFQGAYSGASFRLNP